jgi:hypothetical protein
MINKDVKKILDDCRSELAVISSLLTGLGDGANPTRYIKKYAVIRTTGCIETAFKQSIADKIDKDSHIQIKNYIKRKVRDSSCNPRLNAIETLLSEFDDRWRARFDEQMALDDKPRLKGALTSLVNARNDFAHGGDPDIAITETIRHFNDGVRVIEILDAVVHYNYDEV